jgi:glycosidase
MIWDENQDQSLLNFYTELIHFRRDNPSYWRERKAILVDDHRNLYAYICEPYLVVLNNSSDLSRVSLGNLGMLELILATDLEITTEVDMGVIQLPPYAGGIFRMRNIQ